MIAPPPNSNLPTVVMAATTTEAETKGDTGSAVAGISIIVWGRAVDIHRSVIVRHDIMNYSPVAASMLIPLPTPAVIVDLFNGDCLITGQSSRCFHTSLRWCTYCHAARDGCRCEYDQTETSH